MKGYSQLFSRGHATLELAVSVGQSVGRLVGWSVGLSCHVFDSRAVSALLPLPNRPRLGCRVSGLVLTDQIYFEFVYYNHVHKLKDFYFEWLQNR